MMHRALKTIRQYHRLTQKQMAAELGTLNIYISYLETGKKNAGLDILNKYAKWLGVPLSSLFFLAELLDGDEGAPIPSELPVTTKNIINWMKSTNLT